MCNDQTHEFSTNSLTQTAREQIVVHRRERCIAFLRTEFVPHSHLPIHIIHILHRKYL